MTLSKPRRSSEISVATAQPNGDELRAAVLRLSDTAPNSAETGNLQALAASNAVLMPSEQPRTIASNTTTRSRDGGTTADPVLEPRLTLNVQIRAVATKGPDGA